MLYTIKKSIPTWFVNAVAPLVFGVRARRKGFTVSRVGEVLCIQRNRREIRVSMRHAVYLGDIVDSFDYYFSAVAPHLEQGGLLVVDYSQPKLHKVVGFGDFEVKFPSFSEPLVTTEQYMEFAGLEEGSVVLDLGAYSGLASIIFSKRVGQTGRVVAVDADRANIECLRHNLQKHEEVNGLHIDFLEGAVWEHTNGISFSTEGNMGSSAAEIVGSNRGERVLVPSYTLSEIVDRFGLTSVDFIKCDIEGAEKVVFNDGGFFKRFRPKIIIETHVVDGVETTEEVVAALKKYGYECRKIEQKGVGLPLVECEPVLC